jgi:hypothetical protein
MPFLVLAMWYNYRQYNGMVIGSIIDSNQFWFRKEVSRWLRAKTKIEEIKRQGLPRSSVATSGLERHHAGR